MNQLIQIQTSKQQTVIIPNIEYQGKKVITTELLAQLYGTDSKVIRKNFERNLDRFIENVHYIKLTGADLFEFKKHLYSISYNLDTSFSRLQISSKTRTLYLWTEEGCIHHAKILETDQAWHVFGLLEKAYFNQQNIPANFKSEHKFLEQEIKCRMAIEVAKATGEMLRLSETSKLRMMYKICETYQVDCQFLPYYVEQNPTGSLTQLLKDFGLSSVWTAQKLNLKLEALGILEKMTRKSRSSPSGEKQFWSLTSKGLEFGKNESSPQNPRETQPLYFKDSFLELMKLI